MTRNDDRFAHESIGFTERREIPDTHTLPLAYAALAQMERAERD